MYSALNLYTLTRSLILTGLAMLAIGCTPTPDEEQITAHIHAMAEGVEARQASDVLTHVHDAFRAPHMNNKKDAHRLLAITFIKHKHISIVLTNVTVTLDATYADRAEASFNAIATSGKGLLPHDGQIYRVESQWEKIDDEWLIQSLQWKRAME